MHTAAQPTLFESVVVVGLGNIGSQVVALLPSLPGVKQVRLVDFDRYDSANLGAQRFAARDVGRAKVRVQARVLRRLGPHLEVTAHDCRFEALPLGLLRHSVVLSCVDSRVARQTINHACTALGVPWIDAALAREGSVRARVHLPGHACCECGWGLRDYELLEQPLPCRGTTSSQTPAPTNAVIELGALAAGLQVALCRRLMSGAAAAEALADRQWFYDLPAGHGWVSHYATNPACRLDHARWQVTALGAGSVKLALRDVLALAGTSISAGTTAGAGTDTGAFLAEAEAEATLAAPGSVFVQRLRCPQCGSQRRVPWRLSSRIGRGGWCANCGVSRRAAAVDVTHELSLRNTSSDLLREPLARRGFVAGDIVALRTGDAVQHLQLA